VLGGIMQTAKRIEYKSTADIIDFEVQKKIHSIDNKQKNTEKKPCFRTDERYFCKKTDCEFMQECKKLIAIWMR